MRTCGSNIGECRTGTETCSSGSWGSCVGEVSPSTEICDDRDNDCDGQTDEGCAASCAHDKCSTGGTLNSSCDPCVAQICSVDPFCCATSWDSLCVSEVQSVCGESCGGANSCAHNKCSTGVALTSSCDPCVAQVCAQDSYCCNNSWDSICVAEVGSICGLSCP